MVQTACQVAAQGRRVIDPALLSVAVIWGAGNVSTKWLLGAFEPAALFGMRNLAAALLMGVLLVIRRRSIGARDLLVLLVVGGGIVAAQQLSFVYATSMTTASEASLLVSTAPVFTALMVAMLGMERVSRLNWAGIAVASVGIAMLVLGQGGYAPNAPARVAGDLLMLFAAWLYGLYMVVSKRWMQKLGALLVTCYSFIGAGVMLGIVGLPQIMTTNWVQVTWAHWLWFLFLAVGAGFLGIVIWYRSIGRTTASGTAVYQYLVPCISFIAAAAFLQERLSAVQIAGIVVTLAGVYLARLPSPECRPA